ncbi:MAG: sulfatase-like hydrolase/transferase [Pseudomonadota bacterium]
MTPKRLISLHWLAILAACGGAQDVAPLEAHSDQPYHVEGVVSFDDFPLAGVIVSVDGQHHAVRTDHTGQFSFKVHGTGEVTLHAERYGFNDTRLVVDEDRSSDSILTINMKPTDQVLEAAANARTQFEEHLPEKEAYLEELRRLSPKAMPNVIFILFDDLGYGDLSSYGSQMIDTPAIDAAAKAGALFTDFYAGAPSCTPSRASFLTGRYPNRSLASNHVFYPDEHPVTLFRRALGYANALPRDEVTIAEILSAVGYRTHMIGKWHLGDVDGNKPLDFGFDGFFGALHSNDMQPFDIYRGGTLALADGRFDQSDLTRLYTDEAIKLISAEAAEPFFLYFAHTFPHVPHFADPDHQGESRAGKYGDVVADLDRSVRRVVQAVERAGVAEETLIIITSDNGAGTGGSSAPFKGRKGQILEGGMRVPMIALWPGVIESGTEVSAIGIGADLLPTLTNMLSVPLPQDRMIDGKSLWPVLTGKEKEVHEAIYYFHSRTGEPVAVRQGPFKYFGAMDEELTLATYPVAGGFQQKFRSPRLYDLSIDPLEAHSISTREAEVAAQLVMKLAAMREQARDNPRGWLESSAPTTEQDSRIQ